MQIISAKSQIQIQLDTFRNDNKTIGFVPTMGALHQGHLSLVKIAKQKADIVVVSIFVNPEQFAPDEDFDQYPRNIESDLQKLESLNPDIIYLPTKDEIYPAGFDEYISVGDVGKILEGVARPHFFDGVATVVQQLFKHVKPDIAVFGEKDYQQLHIIRKLVSDVKIIGGPIIRETDGLAMSSRNVYLSDNIRPIASNLYKTIVQIAQNISAGENISQAIAWGENNLLQSGFDKVDYLQLCDQKTLASTNIKPARLIAAAYLDNIRLLDNIAVD